LPHAEEKVMCYFLYVAKSDTTLLCCLHTEADESRPYQSPHPACCILSTNYLRQHSPTTLSHDFLPLKITTQQSSTAVILTRPLLRHLYNSFSNLNFETLKTSTMPHFSLHWQTNRLRKSQLIKTKIKSYLNVGFYFAMPLCYLLCSARAI